MCAVDSNAVCYSGSSISSSDCWILFAHSRARVYECSRSLVHVVFRVFRLFLTPCTNVRGDISSTLFGIELSKITNKKSNSNEKTLTSVRRQRWRWWRRRWLQRRSKHINALRDICMKETVRYNHWSPSYMNDRIKRYTYVVFMQWLGSRLEQHLQIMPNVCSILCSLNHLHESIERLRYTDHSVGHVNVCSIVAAITDVVD